MEKINFQAGELVTPAKVIINEVEHQVIPAQYSGTTPLSPFMLNKLQNNIEVHKYTMTVTANQTGGEITLPCNYKVGNDSLTVQVNTETAIKATTSDTEGHYYEVGEEGSISNKIQLASNAELVVDDILTFYVRGDYSEQVSGTEN